MSNEPQLSALYAARKSAFLWSVRPEKSMREAVRKDRETANKTIHTFNINNLASRILGVFFFRSANE